MATIGIDLTPIQGPHRMRGVGSTAINVLRHISSEEKNKHAFVLFLYEKGKQDALELINAEDLPNYEVRIVTPAKPLPPSIKTMKGLLYSPRRVKDMVQNRRLGDRRILEVEDLDAFLQFEQDVIPPSPNKVRSMVVAHDLIPYVLESDYLWNYKTARRSHNYSRRGALKAHVKRVLYRKKMKSVMSRADSIIANSNHTKNDFVEHIGLPDNKITVIHWGVPEISQKKHSKPTAVSRYTGTSWGDVKFNSDLPDTPFLLFVGGADPRRKLHDLIHAFNLLRAQGHKIHLVLAGDTMLGPNSIPNDEARKALLGSSYLDDIYILGFIDESTKEWLYQNALAFVYPSIYEGFGLPVLEAMRYGTPVVTYKNSSISEITKDVALYASDHISIFYKVKDLIEDTELRSKYGEVGTKHTNKFSWTTTSNHVIDFIDKTVQRH